MGVSGDATHKAKGSGEFMDFMVEVFLVSRFGLAASFYICDRFD